MYPKPDGGYFKDAHPRAGMDSYYNCPPRVKLSLFPDTAQNLQLSIQQKAKDANIPNQPY